MTAQRDREGEEEDGAVEENTDVVNKSGGVVGCDVRVGGVEARQRRAQAQHLLYAAGGGGADGLPGPCRALAGHTSRPS
jgi:hypothetical protein